MDWPKELLEIFDHPLLADVRPKAPALTADDRMCKKLMEITEWVEANNGIEPQLNGNLKEKVLARSLASLRREANEALKAYDRLKLLEGY